MECGCLVYTAPDTQDRLSCSQKLLDKNFEKQESDSETQIRKSYKNSSHVVRSFEVLDSLRKEKVLCDVHLETEDGTLVYGHKVVLASATPYFQTMFTGFEGKKISHVILRELDSTVLKLLVDFIYTGEITVADDYVQVLLHAANLLQLHDVKKACCDFLQTQLNPNNCLGFKSLIHLYDCVEYLSSFKSYILGHFSEVVEGDEFLNLPCDELVELISCNELNGPSEENVFECVVNWVNHDLSNRKDVLPRLMEHIRLPLVSTEYLYDRVREEPLLKSSIECRFYLEEALFFHLSKSIKPGIIRTIPRQPVCLPKVILVFGKERHKLNHSINMFDPSANKWQSYGDIPNVTRIPELLAVLNDRLLIFSDSYAFHIFDLFSSSICSGHTVPMLKNRIGSSVGVLDNCIYIIGGRDTNFRSFKCAEVFNYSDQCKRMISEMSVARHACGVGVINNYIYAVGGDCKNEIVKSVERYCPRTNTWTPVADLNERRYLLGVGVLNGIMYAVGGVNDFDKNLKSVEAYNPSSNTWISVSDMHKCRNSASVVALNGFLYVLSVESGSKNIYSAEMYDPKSNIWTMLSEMMNTYVDFGNALVINKPIDFF